MPSNSVCPPIQVDISFHRLCGQEQALDEDGVLVHSGHAMSMLLSDYVERFPMLRPLCLVFKLFLREQGLHRPYSGGLASVSLMCMIITYLRQPYVDCTRSADVGKLFMDFLDFFGNRFCYAATGISIHAGFFARPPGENSISSTEFMPCPSCVSWNIVRWSH